MISSKALYFPLLKLTVFCTAVVLARTIFDPNIGKTTSFTFPEQVLLSRSQFVEGKAIVETSTQPKYWSNLEGHQYSYRYRDRAFDVKVRYLTISDGDIAAYLKEYSFKDHKVELKPIDKQGQTGFYRLFEHDQVAYLSSCINSRGPSTINREQFFANRNAQDLQINRLLPVMLGMEDIRDGRCVWITVSTSIDNRSIKEVHQQLEAVWQDVYAWWMPRFPKV